MSSVFIREVETELPLLGLRRLPFAPDVATDSPVTILIGRNGSGKSSLLRDLVLFLQAYYYERPKVQWQKARLQRLIMDSDGHRDEIFDSGARSGLRGSVDPFLGRGDGPRKIIALSFTPFDKFPPGDNHRIPREQFLPNIPEAQYVYLGFRGGVRMSPRHLLLQSIDQLAFSASRPVQDRRVVDVLAAIGYHPVLNIDYHVNRLDKVLEARHLDRPRIERMLESIQPLLSAGHTRSHGVLSYRFDFEQGAADNSNFNRVEYATIRELVHANVLQMASVTLGKITGGEVRLLELSSGELNLLCGFLGLAAHLEAGCVVLIDEPENSLHPEWQLRYVQMLGAVMSSRPGCHYVVATHSPMIVSGFAGRGCAVLRLDDEQVVVEEAAVANVSPDAALLGAFNVLTPENSFLKQLVLEAVTLIEQGRQKGERAQRVARFLLKFQEDIPKDDRLHNLVASICLAIIDQ
ncbi:ATP-binding protein [Stenotrophomonas sp. B2]|nr:ATP-binding protein [Stenotrophomonas sp. B2]